MNRAREDQAGRQGASGWTGLMALTGNRRWQLPAMLMVLEQKNLKLIYFYFIQLQLSINNLV